MLLESVPLLDPALERVRLATQAVQGETPSAIDRLSGCAFRTRCPAVVSTCADIRPDTETIVDSHQVACLRWRDIVN